MLRIGVQTGGPERVTNVDGAYRIIKETGFDCADANIDHLMDYKAFWAGKPIPAFDCTDKESVEYFKPWKESANKYGIENYQAHAPFPTLADNEEQSEWLLNMLKKCIIGCDFIDCRKLIIHPFMKAGTTPEEEWNINIEHYSALIPTAKQYGVTICLENMFDSRNGKIFEACCSDISMACKYIDTLNDIAGEKCFAFCLDTGHLLLLGKKIKESMIMLGNRIEAFHIHDNNGISDQHLAPYMGIQDWNEFVEGLKAIAYNQNLSFETFNIWNVVDPEIAPHTMRMIAETGRMFIRRMSKNI